VQRIIQRKITTIQIFSAEIIWAEETAAGETVTPEKEPNASTSSPPPKRFSARRKKAAAQIEEESGEMKSPPPARTSKRTPSN
jgi:hypothetical protein